MARLQDTIAGRVRDAIGRALGADLAVTDPLVRPAQDPRFGDYQANVAMGLGKRLGRKPREVADAIVAAFDPSDLCARPDVAGPGFVNVRLDDGVLARLATEAVRDGRLGVARVAAPETVVVDYSGPNVAKEMHVGHLRSTVLGDAAARTLEFLAHHVVRQNHVGDWGTQFGLLIEHLVDIATRQGRDPADVIGDLTALYREAATRDACEPDFAARARERVVALQAGDEQSRRIWKALVAVSEQQFQTIYQRLGVALTMNDVRGESFYNDRLAAVVADLRASGLARDSQGAVCVFLDGFATKDGDPLPLIVQKSDGGYLYATTDLAAVRYRVAELGARRVIYVTDARQRQHFQMVFATARAAGWVPEGVRLEHAVFGSVLGEDGKPFRTRSGDTVPLADLLTEAEERALSIVVAKNPALPPDERVQIARAVGIGAIKYADLASDRVKDYVFSWSRMLAMDGNTAPYLQYAYARIRAIFRKGGLVDAPAAPIILAHPAERALVLLLLQLDAVVDVVGESLEPHRLCGYLYDVATAFSAFYEACPVLGADPPLRASRLVLCQLTARTLETGLGLLGIDTVDRM
ncbi:MAG: arginine--tRNA ligase [Candidatus Binatia bacterium]